MTGETDMEVIFRSADHSAREDAEEIRDLLADAGLSPVIAGDDAPGVPSGAYEVRVPTGEARRADEIIAAAVEVEPEEGDPSHDMDLETIFSSLGATAEVEALGVRGVLESNGIPTVYVSPPQYPNLRFVIKVPKKHAEEARRLLAEAEAAGPQAAEEAEKASEG
jgi:hypothetical protein